ncbi:MULTISPECIES: ABC transporter ATP-binding protein [Thermus]|jgi:NitT/TauT family transport system ATP-binding protein|uniref:Iron ABC transporter ATP-binding protein n=1 Tax=Thermus brockianus TaxID=56956 RepID=A0A1J0LV87_THEBO|nr:ABC transporter ATP-binding protein [Thermus brockianus]APD10345.1 iron ABC transporter ATP-binding protein [Thermus brockianus]
MNLLEFRQVTVAFGDYVAVEEVSLALKPGEFVGLVGPTGCGKSTLLNVAAGLLAPSQGEVLVEGRPLKGLNPLAGYLFQQDAILPWKTALDNVALPLVFRGRPWTEARREALAWLEKVGLGRFPRHFPHQLSGGMRKRVGLAQVLIAGPRLLLMDEPFSALDVQTRQLMENELLRLWQEDRKTVLFVTHDLEEAIALSDRVVVLSAGPRSRPIGEFPIPLPRPRDVAEIRLTPEFLRLHREIWELLRGEVMRAHAGA